MAQLSRPYQIGLVAVALLAAAWLLLLQGHSSSNNGSSASARVAGSPSPNQSAAGTHPGSTSGPTAPGVSGLTHAIAKAQGAAAISQQSSKRLEEKSNQASSNAPASPSSSSSASTSKPSSSSSSSSASRTSHHSSSAAAPASKATTAPSKATTAPSKATTAPTKATTAPSTTAPSKATSAPSATKPAPSATKPAPNASTRATVARRQLVVESQLHQGKIALILFWNPKGTDDVAVHRAVQQLRTQRGLNVAVNVASSREAAAFGSITRGVQVYGTPTLLVVNGKGHATTLTGLQDAYAIKQAIRETRHA